jgi:hypothetical protein
MSSAMTGGPKNPNPGNRVPLAGIALTVIVAAACLVLAAVIVRRRRAAAS